MCGTRDHYVEQDKSSSKGLRVCVCVCVCVCEDSIMNPTKYDLKKWEKEGVK
jgi:hypothetical protein